MAQAECNSSTQKLSRIDSAGQIASSSSIIPIATRDPIEMLADSFLDRFRRGERPSIEEYAAKHPELADEIREYAGGVPLFIEEFCISARGGADWRPVDGGRRVSTWNEND